jgi:hypothetical protein
MTPTQYVAQLKRLGLTPYGAAPVLVISRRQSIRYAQGESDIPEIVAKLIRAMIALGTTEV